MAAVRNVSFSLDNVLRQEIANNSIFERPPDYMRKVEEALGSLAHEKGCRNVDVFVVKGIDHVKTLLEISTQKGSADTPSRAMSARINPRPILQREAQLCLAGIQKRIGGRRSIKNPYYGEICRDISYEIFIIISLSVRGVNGILFPK